MWTSVQSSSVADYSEAEASNSAAQISFHMGRRCELQINDRFHYYNHLSGLLEPSMFSKHIVVP